MTSGVQSTWGCDKYPQWQSMKAVEYHGLIVGTSVKYLILVQWSKKDTLTERTEDPELDSLWISECALLWSTFLGRLVVQCFPVIKISLTYSHYGANYKIQQSSRSSRVENSNCFQVNEKNLFFLTLIPSWLLNNLTKKLQCVLSISNFL